MTYNGELHTLEITDNEGWNKIENYRHWKITDNGD